MLPFKFLYSRSSVLFKTIGRVGFSDGTRRFNDVAFEDIPSVTTHSIRKVLKTHNIQFEEGYACLVAVCPFCHKSGKLTPSTSKIYINKNTGSFSASSCQHSGQWNVLQSYVDTLSTKQRKNIKVAKFEDLEKTSQIIEELQVKTTTLKETSPDSLSEILMKFSLPQVANSTLEDIDIRIDEHQLKLYFPLENVDSKIVGYRVLPLKGKETVIPNAHCSGILTSKNNRYKETAVVIPTIKDFLTLLNGKVPASIVCLPNGLKNLPQHVLPSLERFNKLILWFGNDIIAWDVAKNYAKKLGERRCFLVRPTEKHTLPHLSQQMDYKSVMSSAQPVWHKSITTFSNLREDVLSDLQNIDRVQGIKWTRYPTLNKILKGHRKGELTVFTGPTGSGKTTFMSEYSLDLAMQGVNTLWGSFEIRNARLARTMLQQLAGIPLDENLDQFDYWADKFEELPIYYMTFHGQQPIRVVMEAVEHATYVHDISHVIIDNVQFMMGMSDEPKHVDRFWKQDAIIASFRSFATKTNCHVSLVIHPRKERDNEDLTTSSIFGGAKASQEADNVLIIQDKRLSSLRGKKYLQVAKNRYSGDLGVMQLEFDKASLSYAKFKKKPIDDKTDDKRSAPSITSIF